ncbi:hypothetical protein RSOCI_06040 [Rhabdochlamydiaceae symbiont of Dictyostelium giganteum]
MTIGKLSLLIDAFKQPSSEGGFSVDLKIKE